ncbi:MAG: hypothetical protein DMG25_19850 [Acidobacteria bacterium]|nr:MAG: hypothetical protein DMG25_19850 [Acidobacteriota bacterium]
MATALIVDETFDNILLVRPLYVAVRLGIIRRFRNALLYWPTYPPTKRRASFCDADLIPNAGLSGPTPS